MKFFSRKAHKVTPTGKVIDMTKTTWGHNISMSQSPDDKGNWRAAIWNGSGAAVGDELTWMHSNGIVKSILTKVEHTGNVWDMYFVEGTITHLNDERIN